ncbi:CCR4-NOT transcription complex subunit 9 [Nematocida major]|uniref:CCR4-NOT transcription complex subunit 9 n=1 Tax=Nematocida major TaxID=1912982 RepID=UPI002008D069|nr:CCR4-NOT transcription complex subunit 9 [Nematocida major]KAH9386488.1 CCR4-NOT transcription complex subunit 9 [Nematocida major]
MSNSPSTYEHLCACIVRNESKDESLKRLKAKLEESAAYKSRLVKEFGVLSVFLKEISEIYDYLIMERSSIPTSIYTILEIVILLTDIDSFIEYAINSNLLLFLYPIINSSIRNAEIEELKYTTLCIIKCILNKHKIENLIEFFKNTELVPLCLRNMELGSKKTKIEASEVFYLIISIREGLEYSCQTYDRFMAISMILNSVLVQLESIQSPELLELIIKIYTKLCNMPNAKLAFNKNRPHMLYTESIREIVRTNEAVKAAYDEFLNVLQS